MNNHMDNINKKLLYLNLENFQMDEAADTPYILTSPLSLRACRTAGVKPIELLHRSLDDITQQMDLDSHEAYQIYLAYEDERRRKLKTCQSIRNQFLSSLKPSQKEYKSGVKKMQHINNAGGLREPDTMIERKCSPLRFRNGGLDTSSSGSSPSLALTSNSSNFRSYSQERNINAIGKHKQTFHNNNENKKKNKKKKQPNTITNNKQKNVILRGKVVNSNNKPKTEKIEKVERKKNVNDKRNKQINPVCRCMKILKPQTPVDIENTHCLMKQVTNQFKNEKKGCNNGTNKSKTAGQKHVMFRDKIETKNYEDENLNSTNCPKVVESSKEKQEEKRIEKLIEKNSYADEECVLLKQLEQNNSYENYNRRCCSNMMEENLHQRLANGRRNYEIYLQHVKNKMKHLKENSLYEELHGEHVRQLARELQAGMEQWQDQVMLLQWQALQRADTNAKLHLENKRLRTECENKERAILHAQRMQSVKYVEMLKQRQKEDTMRAKYVKIEKLRTTREREIEECKTQAHITADLREQFRRTLTPETFDKKVNKVMLESSIIRRPMSANLSVRESHVRLG